MPVIVKAALTNVVNAKSVSKPVAQTALNIQELNLAINTLAVTERAMAWQ